VSQARNSATHEIKLQLIALAVAGACATMSGAAFAQAQEAAPGSPATTDISQPQAAATTVTVTGIRASMQSTLNLKRNSDGIVDGIVADDIGKFPDTNLAEAVQRISGVSIDRSNGEGQRVTVRGVGPDLNMVLLNGRNMPTSNIDNRGSRAFDFSNLASEAVSQIQVYKSSRSDTPSGGIGATLNIMTGRPLDLGNQTSVGGKIDYDRSNNNIPGLLKGANLTPEVSALISRKFGQDDMFGVSLSASYQKRNSGFANAQTPNGFNGPFAANDASGTLSGAHGVQNLAAGQLYDTPQNLSYTLGGTQRKRTNAQLTLQFRPTKDWTNTLDYTYAQNKQHFLQNSLNVWMNQKDKVTGVNFLNGPVQTAGSYSESYAGSPQDFDMVSEDSGTKTTLKSIGFNSQFRVNSGLKFSLDVHHSTSESGSDSPFGTANDLSGVSFGRVANSIDYTKEMPVLNMTYAPQPWQVSGSWFDDAHLKQTIDQIQLGGSLKIGESSNLSFGGAHIKTKFGSEYNHVAANAWTGVVAPSQRANAGQFFNQANYHPEDYRRYFSKLGGSDDPSLFPFMQVLDFQKVRQDLINFTTTNNANVNHADQAAPFVASQFSPSLVNPQEARALQEKTNSLYTQFNTEWDTAMPIHTGFGVRYEKTKVDTQYNIRPPVLANWATQNEIEITNATSSVPQQQASDYHYWLPTADFDIDLLSNVKFRASWGMSIGRPNWDLIQGGMTLSPPANVRGLNGSQGNPALKPVKSSNLDLSTEWYYSKTSFVSIGYYNKDLSGYAGTTIQNVPSTTLKTPVGSPAYLAAVSSCGGTSTFCVRNYIFKNYNGQPGVISSGIGADGNYTGQITSDIAGAVPMPLLLSTTVNANKSNLKGVELNWTHMFDNGFGFQSNYTYVKSGLHYNNAAPSAVNGSSQFAMVGMANSANLVGIYENDKTSVRLAYNWRGEFLNNLAAAGQAQPGYTEAYGQLDLSVGYNLTKNLSLSLEGINITNSTQRQHGRTSNEIISAQVTGPRYMVGARYKF
jgi:TonB-dependent receptor